MKGHVVMTAYKCILAITFTLLGKMLRMVPSFVNAA